VSWLAVERALPAPAETETAAVVAELVAYHEARERRDFPNAMARAAPPEPEPGARLERALQALRLHDGDALWRIVRAMTLQRDDDGLVWTGVEVAARLAPKRLDALADALRRERPDRGWIVDRIRERWLAAP
jgi:hypothetical protein